MTLNEIIEKRRSVRSFETTPVDGKDLLAICEAARLAPYACNSQTWRFITVSDRSIIQRIAREAMRSVEGQFLVKTTTQNHYQNEKKKPRKDTSY